MLFGIWYKEMATFPPVGFKRYSHHLAVFHFNSGISEKNVIALPRHLPTHSSYGSGSFLTVHPLHRF